MASRVERIRIAANQIPEVSAPIIAKALKLAIDGRGEASLCLAGGNTPKATYQALTQAAELPWSRVSVYFGDERCVPPDHPQSNYRLAREALLDQVEILSGSVHRIRAESSDPGAAAEDYARLLPGAFDVLILGIGEDGHTASLFPGSPLLRETQRLALPVTGPKAPFERITLTPPALVGRLTLVLAAGGAKSNAVARALEGPLDLDGCPAQLARDAVWILDHAAAAQLTGAWPG